MIYLVIDVQCEKINNNLTGFSMASRRPGDREAIENLVKLNISTAPVAIKIIEINNIHRRKKN
jgi:hypothetical protein